MRLAAFSTPGDPTVRLGRVVADGMIDVARACPDLPPTLRALLAAGPEAVARAARADGPLTPLDALRLHAPIPDPEKMLAIGLNYADHGAEVSHLDLARPESQKWFNKQVSCIAGPRDDIVMPRVSDQLDHEVELALVIGTACREVDRDGARRAIAGYMVANDVSVRDWQFRSPTVTLGKSFDTHGPTGPWLTLAEAVDPAGLALTCTVDGVVRQSGSTRDLIHDGFDLVAYLSQVMTLKPGDIVLTGTPAGVGIAADPPRFLRAGQVVRCEIEGLGAIENRVVAPAP